MDDVDSDETLINRQTRLRQLICGRDVVDEQQDIPVGFNELLDALFVLYNECSKDSFKRNKYASGFVKKYATVIEEFKRLRVSVNDFDVKGIIGHGHFGEIQVARERGTNNVYALKILHKADVLSQQNVSFYDEERSVMARANSEWITQLHYAFQDQHSLYLAMDFHPGGDLLSLLNRHDDLLDEASVRFYLAEIVAAVHSLHCLGYVHRDIKPENVLIDRTGHIKLVDFGSACRVKASASVVNVPVGTPDYLCPEVLTRLQETPDGRGHFSEDCDWWSVGICAYEMLYGRTPFTDESSGSMVVTYANIMNHKDCLTFPSSNGRVSQSAENLIRSLLRESENRLDYDGIRAHPFFADINFDDIRQTTPPFIPHITSDDDTSNFDDFEIVKSVHFAAESYERNTGFTGKDLPFIGFTFTRMFLTSKKPTTTRYDAYHVESAKPTDGHREICSDDAELQIAELKTEVDSLRRQLADRDSRIVAIEDLRQHLERQLLSHTAEISGLKRSLELEKKKNVSVDTKASRLLDEFTLASEQDKLCMQQDFSKQLAEQNKIVVQLEEENENLGRKIHKLEKQLLSQNEHSTQQTHHDHCGSVDEVRIQIKHKYKEIYHSKIRDLCHRLKQQQHNFSAQEKILHDRAEQAITKLCECRQQLDRAVAEKSSLETDVDRLSQECTKAAAHLHSSEDKSRALQCKAEQLESREQELSAKMNALSAENVSLKTKMAELEMDIERLNAEKNDIHNQSIHVVEQSDQRQQKIKQLEAMVVKLKANVLTLEVQVDSLKADLTEIRRSQSLSSADRDSLSRFEHSQITSEPDDGPDERHDPRFSFSYVYKRNKTRDWVLIINVANTDDDETCQGTDMQKDSAAQCIFKSPEHRCYHSCSLACSKEEPESRSVHVHTTNGVSSIRCSKDTYTTVCNGETLPKTTDRLSSDIDVLNDTLSDLVASNSDTSGHVVDVKFSTTVRCKKHLEISRSEALKRSSGSASSSEAPKLTKTISTCSTQTDFAEHVNGRQTVEDEDLMSSLKAKNENLESEVLRLRQKIEEQVKLHSSCTEAEMNALRTEKKRLEELVAGTRNERQQNAGDNSAEVVKELTTQKVELEEKLASLSAELEHYRLPVSEDAIAELSTLRDEKQRLDTLITYLENEVQQHKDTAHEQRIRALDLKHELREKTAAMSTELADLNFRLSKTELEAAEASENLVKCRERESEQRDRLQQLQKQCDDARSEQQKASAALASCKADLEVEIDKLRSQLESAQKTEQKAKLEKDECKLELDQTKETVGTISTKLKDVESQLSSATSEKHSLQLSIQRAQSDLTEQKRLTESLQLQVDQLKELSTELESQVQDMEKLVECKELKLRDLTAKHEGEVQAATTSNKMELSRVTKDLDATKATLAQHKMSAETLNSQLAQLDHKCSVLESENQSLRSRLEGPRPVEKSLSAADQKLQTARDEKNRLVSELRVTRQELSECQTKLHHTEELSTELESQIADLEHIVRRQKEDVTRVTASEVSHKKTIETLETEVKKLQSLLSSEKQLRTSRDERLSEVSHKLESIKSASSLEVNKLKTELSEHVAHTALLNDQLTKSEEKRSLVEVDFSNVKQRIVLAEREIVHLKEEISKEITRSQELKAQNTALQKQLRSTTSHYQSLATQRNSLENKVETIQMNHQHEKYRMEETMSQQTKLIGFLQDKVESTPRKKRWLFSGRHSSEMSANGQPQALRDAYSSLQRERDKARPLTIHITQPSGTPSGTRPRSEGGQEMSLSAETTAANRGATLPVTSRPPKYPETHSHKLITGINSRPTMCIVCLGSIHFIQQAAKCQDCGAVCHPRCLPNLPPNCGLPSDYARFTADVRHGAVNNGRMMAAKKSASALQLAAYVKLPRAGKTVWERKWIMLRDNKLLVYNSREESTSGPTVDEFDLCPHNGVVSVCSAVTQTELANVSASELVYVLMLEFEPDTVNLSNRCFYLMTMSFAEKQQWVAMLEAVTSNNKNSNKITDASVFGNIIFHMSHDDRRMDVMCTWPLSDDLLLMGTDCGLFAMQFTNDVKHRPLTHVAGIEGSVHAIDGHADPGLAFFVVGGERDVVTCELRSLILWLTSPHGAQPPVKFQPIPRATACTVFALKRLSDGLFLALATTENVILYKYDSRLHSFTIQTEVSVGQPSSCIAFMDHGVVYATNKFYVLSFNGFTVTEFLDMTDRSLAFAVFGATQYDSFPVAVLPVSSDELLLCFDEFGVFVDNCGRRSRRHNIRWTGLPLAFAYREPFLYTIHYNAVQVMHIADRGADTQMPPVDMKTFVNLIGAQFLGPALSPGAVYVASVLESSMDILCIKGNVFQTTQHSLVNGDGRVDESGFVSSSSTPHLPAAAASRKPTAPSASRVRCGSLSSNSSTASSSYM